MTVKEYDSENPVTMAGEPAVAYVNRCGSQARAPQAQSPTPPPCQYTEEEVVQRVLQATAEAESGIGCLTLDEFETLVETW